MVEFNLDAFKYNEPEAQNVKPNYLDPFINEIIFFLTGQTIGQARPC